MFTICTPLWMKKIHYKINPPPPNSPEFRFSIPCINTMYNNITTKIEERKWTFLPAIFEFQYSEKQNAMQPFPVLQTSVRASVGWCIAMAITASFVIMLSMVFLASPAAADAVVTTREGQNKRAHSNRRGVGVVVDSLELEHGTPRETIITQTRFGTLSCTRGELTNTLPVVCSRRLSTN